MKFIGTNGAIFNGCMYCLVSILCSCNDCLMDFKDDINDVFMASLVMRRRYLSDQRWLNLGYLLDPS
jgi:hypothetical protein